MLSLKAIVFEKEQQRQTQPKQPKQPRVLSKKTVKDTEATHRNKPDERELAAQAALAAKAALYEDILAGRAEGDATLVDFGKKRPLVTEVPDSPPSPPRKVAAISGDYGPQQWQWSRGDTTHTSSSSSQPDHHDPDGVVAEWASAQRAERSFREETDRRIAAMPISQGARVKTQWEKTLESSARGFIDDVHRETELMTKAPERSAREEKLEMLKQMRMKMGMT